MHAVYLHQSTDEKSGSIVACKDSYLSDSWLEECLEEMNARKQGIYARKPSSGMTSGKVRLS